MVSEGLTPPLNRARKGVVPEMSAGKMTLLYFAQKSQVAISRTAVQRHAPVTIAAPKMAAAERRLRAEIELVAPAAMIGTIWATAESVYAAMIAKSRWQQHRVLPIHADHQPACRRPVEFTRSTGRHPRHAGQKNKGKNFHRIFSAWGFCPGGRPISDGCPDEGGGNVGIVRCRCRLFKRFITASGIRSSTRQ